MIEPKQYVEKHAYVQAMQLENTVESAQAVAEWCEGIAVVDTENVYVERVVSSGVVSILTPGCWVIKEGGKFLACSHENFEVSYEESFRMPSWVYDHPDVCTNPHRMGGQPCVRGTRVPVGIIFNLMDGPDGATDEEVSYFYPHVPADKITRLRIAREEHNNDEF